MCANNSNDTIHAKQMVDCNKKALCNENGHIK